MRFLVVLPVLAGCAQFNVDLHNKSSHDVVRKLAAFDLSCDIKDIHLIELNHHGQDMGAVAGAVNTMGAEGCGRRTTYIVGSGTASAPKWNRNSEVMDARLTGDDG